MTEEYRGQVAKKIVGSIVDDLSDRMGLGDEWDEIDIETQEDILTCWEKLAQVILDDYFA